MRSIVDYVMIFKGRGLKMGVFVGGGGGGLTWTLILRIFGMVSITFFFAPPPRMQCNLFSFWHELHAIGM